MPHSMVEGKPCVKRVRLVGGGTKFEALNLPKRTPGAVHRHVGGTICPMGFTCNTCDNAVRKFTKITCYIDYFPKPLKGEDYKLHMFDEIIYDSANKSFISGGTVYIPPGCSVRSSSGTRISLETLGVRLGQTAGLMPSGY
ncbi:NAD(P)H-quinone oxidoreductase subunit j chloroplastic [Phtheirospermum japonicum]|uniref:NAD(P)H-quinone oxidoreductase subunit j chloroplastic n=1 Tax=Phtheirospermum japonicum TaxID=374723 RepID=A0A830DAK2_9LAMI|nr:NAD(P)H-quinone oxidoreductase subunit j chloroplastic [Phtheirospermum japonicum]